MELERHQEFFMIMPHDLAQQHPHDYHGAPSALLRLSPPVSYLISNRQAMYHEGGFTEAMPLDSPNDPNRPRFH